MTSDSVLLVRATTKSKFTSYATFLSCMRLIFSRRRPRRSRDASATRQDSSSSLSTGGDEGLPQHLSLNRVAAATPTAQAAGLFHL